MDKLKLFSTNKNHISKSIIDNNFNYISSSYDTLQHNKKITFGNAYTNIIYDKYGIVVKTNTTKYLRENNLHQIDRKEVIEFRERFEQELRINTNNFQITGFDYKINISTNYPPKSYLSTIRTLPKYKQTIHQYSEGISFINNCKSFTLYDKIKQLVTENVTIPIDYQRTYLLRLELGVKGKMKQTNNLKTINTLREFSTPDKYILVVNEFENIYNKIHKHPLLRFTDMKTPNPEIIKTDDFALLFYINEIGMETYLNQLTQEKDMGLLTYRQFKTRKDKALQLWNTYERTDNNTNDLLTEMNLKVGNRIREIKELALE